MSEMKSLLTVEGRQYIRSMLRQWENHLAGGPRPGWTPADTGSLPDATRYALVGLLNEDANRRSAQRKTRKKH